MKKAILEDSQGDMDEGERMRQLDALEQEDNSPPVMPRARDDDDSDRLSQGLEPRSWSHAQPAADPRGALAEFAEDLQRDLSGAGPQRQVREPRMSVDDRVVDVEPGEGADELRPSREGVGLLNGHTHHAHHAHRAMPAAHSAAVASALLVLAPALFL